MGGANSVSSNSPQPVQPPHHVTEVAVLSKGLHHSCPRPIYCRLGADMKSVHTTGRRSTLSPIFGCNQSHSSPGLWAATAASYCPSRPVELPKLIATEYRTQGAAPPCTSIFKSNVKWLNESQNKRISGIKSKKFLFNSEFLCPACLWELSA